MFEYHGCLEPGFSSKTLQILSLLLLASFTKAFLAVDCILSGQENMAEITSGLGLVCKAEGPINTPVDSKVKLKTCVLKPLTLSWLLFLRGGKETFLHFRWKKFWEAVFVQMIKW